MSFWNRERWLTEGGKGNGSTPVLPWREDCVEAAGYRLSVDKEYFVNEDGSSSVVKLDHEDTFVVNLGQFAFILTKENVRISKSAIGFISIRASLQDTAEIVQVESFLKQWIAFDANELKLMIRFPWACCRSLCGLCPATVRQRPAHEQQPPSKPR